MRHSRVGIAAIVFAAMLSAVPAFAQDASKKKEAAEHFQRAVSLYNETDYNAALVEFKRAYAIAPNVNVLYNIGQAQYQLQRYAQALETFNQYIAGGGTSHKADVEDAINILKSRVGQLNITIAVAGADIQIDDESVGQSPLARPVAASVGRRKITVIARDHAPVTKWVEVGANETLDVPIALEEAAPPLTGTQLGAQPQPTNGNKHSATIGWLATGVLTSGAVVTGLLAFDFSNKLRDARNTFPGNQADISNKASLTTAFAITTDVLAGLAAVGAGLSLYWTLSRPASSSSPEIKAGLGPGSFYLVGTF